MSVEVFRALGVDHHRVGLIANLLGIAYVDAGSERLGGGGIDGRQRVAGRLAAGRAAAYLFLRHRDGFALTSKKLTRPSQGRVVSFTVLLLVALAF